jgi:hypothetical protein
MIRALIQASPASDSPRPRNAATRHSPASPAMSIRNTLATVSATPAIATRRNVSERRASASASSPSDTAMSATV